MSSASRRFLSMLFSERRTATTTTTARQIRDLQLAAHGWYDYKRSFYPVLVHALSSLSSPHRLCSSNGFFEKALARRFFSSLSNPKKKTKKKKNKNSSSSSSSKTSTTTIRADDALTQRKEEENPVVLSSCFPTVKITCLPGLEAVLHDELVQLLARGVNDNTTATTKPTFNLQTKRGAVTITSNNIHHDNNHDSNGGLTPTHLAQLHLYLGSASQILVPLGNPFHARALGEVQRKVAQQRHWAQLIACDKHNNHMANIVVVKTTAQKSRLMHTTAVSERVRNGIYAALGIIIPDAKSSSSSSSPPPNKETESMHILVNVKRDQVSLWWDTASGGTPLHRRAWRLATAKAPLREDIAYAALYAAGWKPSYYYWQQQQHDDSIAPWVFDTFIDPFCGSGTLPIEAAAMRAGLPPGRLRPAPLGGTRLYNPRAWKTLIQQHKQQQQQQSNNDNAIILASDRNAGAMSITAANAQRAGVTITCQTAAFSSALMDGTFGKNNKVLMVSNLPYGRRLAWSKQQQQQQRSSHHFPFYQKLVHSIQNGVFCQKNTTAAVMVLTHEPHVLQRTGSNMQWTSHLQTLHGGIKVTGLFASNKKTYK